MNEKMFLSLAFDALDLGSLWHCWCEESHLEFFKVKSRRKLLEKYKLDKNAQSLKNAKILIQTPACHRSSLGQSPCWTPAMISSSEFQNLTLCNLFHPLASFIKYSLSNIFRHE